MSDFACTDNPELLAVEHDDEGAFVRWNGERVALPTPPKPTWQWSMDPPGVRFPDGRWVDAEPLSAVGMLVITTMPEREALVASEEAAREWKILPDNYRMRAGYRYDFIYATRGDEAFRWVRERSIATLSYPETSLSWDDFEGIEGDD